MSNPLFNVGYNPTFGGGFPQIDTTSILGGMTVNNSARGGLFIDIPVGVSTSDSGVVRNAQGQIVDFRPTRQIGKTVADKGVSEVKKAGSDLLNKGKNTIESGIRAAANTNPITAGIMGVSDGLGITGECGWICQIQEWISESGIFQRIALAILAFIFIAVALMLLGKNTVIKEVAGTAGAALKKTGKAAASS